MISRYKLAVLGENVSSYSKSPEIHNKWLKQFNLDKFVYRAIDVKKGALKKHIKQIKDEYLGCNVTIPLKEEIIPLLNEVDKLAIKLKSVNVIKNFGNKLKGYNTDAFGFNIALTNAIRCYNHNIRTVILFGTGGSAKVAYYSLIEELKVTKLIIVSSSNSKIDIQTMFKPEIIYCDYTNYQSYLPIADLLVNATPRNVPANLFNFRQVKKEAILFDLNYNNLKGAFIKEAEVNNLAFIDGSEMLFYQAAASFKIWFDIYPMQVNKFDKEFILEK